MAGINNSNCPILRPQHAKPTPSERSQRLPPPSTTEAHITLAPPKPPPTTPSLALPDPARASYPHSRIAFLRSSADLERRRHQSRISGLTPPYCPFGPTLSRDYIHDDDAYGVGRPEIFAVGRRYERSLLSRSKPLSVASPLPAYLCPGTGSAASASSSSVAPRVTHVRSLAKRMPHAVSMPQTGFQALILCGPGGSLNTFTTVPAEYPKALITLANRPMVWYVLDWCYRMGVTNITLLTPPESFAPLSSALAQNPHLTSLPSPTPSILAPESLTHETGTAGLLRLPEVQACITGDFLLLPCDLVCEMPGEGFLETWMRSLGGLGGATDGWELEVSGPKRVGEKGGRRGGLSVWYSTPDREESVKGEECDFFATAKLDQEHDLPVLKQGADGKTSGGGGVLRKLVWALPMSSLMDECDEAKDQSWHVRSSLLRKYGSVKCLTKFRDAHVYLFPYWVKDFARLNEEFDSVSEDLVGTWAKTDWRKPAYRARYGARELFGERKKKKQDGVVGGMADEVPIEEEIDLMSLSSTQVTRHANPKAQVVSPTITLASRVTPSTDADADADADDSTRSPQNTTSFEPDTPPPTIPPILSYIHSASPTAPLIRRIDTTPLLLSVSLLLARIPSIEESTPTSKPKPNSPSTSPFAHPHKISPTATISPISTSISTSTSLIGDNALISSHCTIQESVIGPSVTLGSRCRITRSVIMDGAVIEDGCVLTECVVGKKAKVGRGCVLGGCEVQDGNAIAEGVEGKGENFLVGGLEDMDDGEDDGDGEEEDGVTGGDDDESVAIEE